MSLMHTSSHAVGNTLAVFIFKKMVLAFDTLKTMPHRPALRRRETRGIIS